MFLMRKNSFADTIKITVSVHFKYLNIDREGVFLCLDLEV